MQSDNQNENRFVVIFLDFANDGVSNFCFINIHSMNFIPFSPNFAFRIHKTMSSTSLFLSHHFFSTQSKAVEKEVSAPLIVWIWVWLQDWISAKKMNTRKANFGQTE